MGTREEAEKLRSPYKNPHFNKIHDKPLDDVLSLLDEHLGELILEMLPSECYQQMFLSYWNPLLRDRQKKDFEIKPGDRIAIYRVRDEK